MELSNFHDFLGLFAALNIGYAGFVSFRSAIDDDILNITNWNNRKVQQLKAEALAIKTIYKFEAFRGEIQTLIDEIFEDRNQRISLIKDRSQDAILIAEGFKSIFLFTAFYCLVIMIVGGYQEYLGQDCTNTFLFIFNFSLLYNIAIFVRSFTTFRSKKISPLIPISLLVFLTIVIIFCFRLRLIPYHTFSPINLEKNIGTSLVVAVSPYILHFLRLFIHRLIYRSALKKNDNDCSKRIEGLKALVIFLYKKKS
jgi:hypothetical protein